MQFNDDEYLLLSRGGRIGPGTPTQLGGVPSAQERARRELAAGAALRRERGPARLPRPLARAVGAIAGAFGGSRRSDYGGER